MQVEVRGHRGWRRTMGIIRFAGLGLGVPRRTGSRVYPLCVDGAIFGIIPGMGSTPPTRRSVLCRCQRRCGEDRENQDYDSESFHASSFPCMSVLILLTRQGGKSSQRNSIGHSVSDGNLPIRSAGCRVPGASPTGKRPARAGIQLLIPTFPFISCCGRNSPGSWNPMFSSTSGPRLSSE